MSDTAKVTITLKAGTGFDSPWIVIHGDTAQEAGAILSEIRSAGVFQGVRAAAQEFATATPSAIPPQLAAAGIPPAIAAAFPEAQVLVPPPSQPACQQASQQPQQQAGGPPCTTCGGPTTFKNGHGKKGPWSGQFCNANRDHAPQWN